MYTTLLLLRHKAGQDGRGEILLEIPLAMTMLPGKNNAHN